MEEILKPGAAKNEGIEYQLWFGVKLILNWMKNTPKITDPKPWLIEEINVRKYGIFDDIELYQDNIYYFIQTKSTTSTKGGIIDENDLLESTDLSIQKMYNSYLKINGKLSAQKYELIIVSNRSIGSILRNIINDNSDGSIESVFIESRLKEPKKKLRFEIFEQCKKVDKNCNEESFRDFLSRIRIKFYENPERELKNHSIYPKEFIELVFNQIKKSANYELIANPNKIEYEEIKTIWESFQGSKIGKFLMELNPRFRHSLKQVINLFYLCRNEVDDTYYHILKEFMQIFFRDEYKPEEIKIDFSNLDSNFFINSMVKNMEHIVKQKQLKAICQNEIESELIGISELYEKLLHIQENNYEYFIELLNVSLEYIDYSNIEKNIFRSWIKDNSTNDLLIKLKNLLDNLRNWLWNTQSSIKNDIKTLSLDELKEYCLTQLDNFDFSSRYDETFDRERFTPIPSLNQSFSDFINNLSNPLKRERIFLLLGHMGLGKTWNAMNLAYEYSSKFPVFCFQLSNCYEDRFEYYFDDFQNANIKEFEVIKQHQSKFFLIFDGFDEISIIERKVFIDRIIQLLEKYNNSLIVLLTSRLIDWINTPFLHENANNISRYIFQKENSKNFEEIQIPTGTSYILNEITDKTIQRVICNKYNIELDKVQDSNIQILLQKPFIIKIIAKNNLMYEIFQPQSDKWFKIFTSLKESEKNNTIIHRMGIFLTVEDDFQELVSEIADPYSGVPEDNLKTYIQTHKSSWDVILSSGIIKRVQDNYQHQYLFQQEYQQFINRYISELLGNFHSYRICKADVKCLETIEQEIRSKNVDLPDITDITENQDKTGFICDNRKRVIGFCIRSVNIIHFPLSICNLLELKSLSLIDTALTKLPENIKKLRNLKKLNLDINKIVHLPSVLKDMKNLERISLKNNPIEEIENFFKDIPNLKWINLGSNKNLENNHSIKYVANDLIHRDDLLNPEKLYLVKDAAIFDYFNTKREECDFTYEQNHDNYAIEKINLFIKKPLQLNSLFWSIENCSRLELNNGDIKFGKNSSIHHIIIKENASNNQHLKIDESIFLCENLEILEIEGFHQILLPDSLKKCLKLKLIRIFTVKSSEIPEILLSLEHLGHILIDEFMNKTDFDNLIKKLQKIDSLILIRLNGVSISELNLKSHIQNFILNIKHNLPSKIIKEGLIRKVIFSKDHGDIESYYNELNFWNKKEIGNLYFFNRNQSNNNIPDLIGDFSKLKYCRIDWHTCTKLPSWCLNVPDTTELNISSETIQTPLMDFFNEKNPTIFEYRVSSNCELNSDFGSLKKLKKCKIHLGGLTFIPESLGNLLQFSRIIITSIDLGYFISQLSAKDQENIMEFYVSRSCRIGSFLSKCNQITHLIIDNVDIDNISVSFSNLTNLKLLWISTNYLTQIPECFNTLSLTKLNISSSQIRNFDQNDLKVQPDEIRPITFKIDTNNSNPFKICALPQITHLNIEVPRRLIFESKKDDFLKLRFIEFTSKLNEYPGGDLQIVKNLSFLKIDISNFLAIPPWIESFKQISQIIITHQDIYNIDPNFWASSHSNCIYIKINQIHNFPSFILKSMNLSHLWIEFPDRITIPIELDKWVLNKKQFKIIHTSNTKLAIQNYLYDSNPTYFVLIVHPSNEIPENLKKYLTEI